MAEDDAKQPRGRGRVAQDPDSREARLAAALRANLRRRKQAQRPPSAGKGPKAGPTSDPG